LVLLYHHVYPEPVEGATEKEDTEAREKFLKSGYGHQQLKEILKRTLITF